LSPTPALHLQALFRRAQARTDDDEKKVRTTSAHPTHSARLSSAKDTQARTHARTHTHAHAHTRTHTHTHIVLERYWQTSCIDECAVCRRACCDLRAVRFLTCGIVDRSARGAQGVWRQQVGQEGACQDQGKVRRLPRERESSLLENVWLKASIHSRVRDVTQGCLCRMVGVVGSVQPTWGVLVHSQLSDSKAHPLGIRSLPVHCVHRCTLFSTCATPCVAVAWDPLVCYHPHLFHKQYNCPKY
jgi:hypothetical protein